MGAILAMSHKGIATNKGIIYYVVIYFELPAMPWFLVASEAK